MQYNFVVPSIVVNKVRSTFTDTDYATLGIVALAPDGTTVGNYGPITRSLGDLDEGHTPIGVGMALTDIDVPDGGFMGVVFTVINKGSWSGKGSIENALNTVCAGIVGALAGGQLVGTAAESTLAFSAWEAALAAAGVLAIMEGLNLLLVDCDGWVVNATMQIGRTELDRSASQTIWQWSTQYPGSDSPDGCGANSNYTVNYEVAASSLEVVVPSLLGQSPQEARETLEGMGLKGVLGKQSVGLVDAPQITSQSPPIGTLMLRSQTITFNVTIPRKGRPPV